MMFFSIAFIHFLACLTPGPASIYALNVLFKNNLKSSMKVICGITIGNAIYIILSILGLTLLQTSNATLNALLYSICAIILLYLGIKGLLASISQDKTTTPSNQGNRYILNGLLITIFNPKVVLFYPIILSSIITKYNYTSKIATALYFILTTFIFLSAIIYFADIFKQKTIKYLKYSQIAFSMAMIVFAALISIKVIKVFILF